MARLRAALLWLGLLAALVVVNYAIFAKERLLAEGPVLLLELAPVDPRSLMQGDFMALRFVVARAVEQAARGGDAGSDDGLVVVAAGPDGIAQFRRLAPLDAELSAGEYALRYRRRGSSVRLGTNAFFFQEGTAQRYAGARYGEVRVGSDGTVLLTGLLDKDRQRLGAALEGSLFAR